MTAMKVTGLKWAGTRTEGFDDTVRFFENVMRLDLEETQSGFASFRTQEGDKFEVFGPEDPDHGFMTSPVVGFGVSRSPAKKTRAVSSHVGNPSARSLAAVAMRARMASSSESLRKTVASA